LADNNKIDGSKMGNLLITGFTFDLEVLVAPALDCIYISVGRFCKDKPTHYMRFDNESVCIVEKLGDKVVLKARSMGSLYGMDLTILYAEIKGTELDDNCVASLSSDRLLTLHQMYGHVSLE